MTERPLEWHNLKQFQIDEVIHQVLKYECDFCGNTLLGDEAATADYVIELLQTNGPLTATELVDMITVCFEPGCCDHCSHFLQKDD